MVQARKYVVKSTFQGEPKRSDYEIVEENLPALKAGEILVKAEYISVDPSLRIMNHNEPVPYDQYSYQVGTVLESNNAKYPVGTKVVSYKGWRDYYIVNPDAPVTSQWERLNIPKDVENGISKESPVYKLPDLKGLPISLGVGAIGMPGVTAYFGFLEICKPKAGETVVVTGAAGACGSLVGQIAKIKGCRVIGFAGSDEKVEWLEKELGFDKVINYKTADVAAALKEAAPNGVDCYFDNVGGELSSIIISQMNHFGRVSVCGIISAYNGDLNNLPKATILQYSLVSKELKIEGIVVCRWIDRWFEALEALTDWISSGKIKAPEHVTVGFENLFDAYVGMLAGKNFGKAVVKV